MSFDTRNDGVYVMLGQLIEEHEHELVLCFLRRTEDRGTTTMVSSFVNAVLRCNDSNARAAQTGTLRPGSHWTGTNSASSRS